MPRGVRVRRSARFLVSLVLLVVFLATAGRLSAADPDAERRVYRACLVNLGSLEEAFDAYALGKDVDPATLTLDQAFLEQLVALKYLPAMPGDPGAEGPSWSHYRRNEKGALSCDVHGDADAIEERFPARYLTKKSADLACASTQKTIGGALEMYRLDEKLEGQPPRLDEAILLALVAKHYLQSWPRDPGFGTRASASHYALGPDGRVTCSKHGSYQEMEDRYPGPRMDPRSGAAVQSCDAIRKTLAGAISMYCLDKNLQPSEVKLDEALFGTLLKDGYLQGRPRDPGFDKGSGTHYQLEPDGRVTCSEHGTSPPVAK